MTICHWMLLQRRIEGFPHILSSFSLRPGLPFTPSPSILHHLVGSPPLLLPDMAEEKNNRTKVGVGGS